MKKFKDSIHFQLYVVEYHVSTKIEGERVSIIVSSIPFYKPLIFRYIEDYKQTLIQILTGLWKEKTNCRVCRESSSVLNLINNQFGSYAAILYDNYRQLGYRNKCTYKKTLSFKAIKHLI